MSSGSWVVGSPYENNTPYIHSFYAVSYQLSLNFHNISKSVVLAQKKNKKKTQKETKKIHQGCHPRRYPNINR